MLEILQEARLIARKTLCQFDKTTATANHHNQNMRSQRIFNQNVLSQMIPNQNGLGIWTLDQV